MHSMGGDSLVMTETQLGLNVREKLGRSVFSIPPKNELRIQHEHEIENCITERRTVLENQHKMSQQIEFSCQNSQ